MQIIKRKYKVIFFILVLTTFLGGAREVGDISGINFIRQIRIACILTTFFFITFNLNFNKQLKKIKGIKTYLFFLLFSLSTIIWAPQKLFLFWKIFEIFNFILFIFWFNQLNYKEAYIQLYEFFLKLVGISVIGVLLTGLFFFEDGFEILAGPVVVLKYKLHGSLYSFNSNDLGFWSGLLFLTEILKNSNKLKFNWKILIFGIILIFSQARVSIAITIFIITIYFLRKNLWYILLFLTTFFLVTFYYFQTIISFFSRGDQSQFTTLHGRTDYWEIALFYIQENLFFGHGFYTGHRFLFEIYSQSDYSSNTFDNTWIDILIDTGLIGLSLILFMFLVLFKRILKIKTSEKKFLLMGFVFILIRSFTGPTFETLTLYLIFLILISLLTYNLNTKY